jgi:hypothetical protein
MAGAMVQGVPGSTIDVDLWIDLPTRQYMRPMNAAVGVGGEMIRNTVVVLPGDLTLNFIFDINGLRSFETEYKKVKRLNFMGKRIPVLPLERIRASKKAVGRPKDVAHILLIDQTLACKRHIKRKKR